MHAMTWEDERDVSWFLSRGQISFERSTLGAMLERSELFSVAGGYPQQRAIRDSDGRIIAYATGVTARPTAEVRAPSGYVVDDSTLQLYAHVSAVLKRVERASPTAARVIETFFGDYGERWAPNELYGRLGSLFHLTAKGAAMVRDARKGPAAHFELSNAQRLEAIVAVHAAKPTPERAEALARCQKQAAELERDARTTWGRVKYAEVA